MKKILSLMLFFSGFIYANVNAVVSILPQKTFVEAIGGDKVNVALMVKPGNSPHSYEPKPSQMKDISKADIYFSIGIDFEHAWLPRFADQNKKMKIVNISKGINRLPMVKHSHGEDEHHDHEEHAHHDHEYEHDHEHGKLDPHVWTSPDNVKVMAKNILKYLVKIDKANEEYYEKNYEEFVESIDETDKKIQTIFKDLPRNAKFMVFHPAWGYFAKQYLLEQTAIEIEGKNPKPKQVAHLIEEAREEGVKAIFTAPEFSDKIAKQIAKELGIPVVKISPLNPKWSQNLIKFAKAIANK